MSEKSYIHSGHRKRMRRRFSSCKYDLASFSDHEVIEMLLFHSYKRQNTNEIAHELTARFGSLLNILTAPVDQLCSIKYIDKAVAADIRLFGELYMFLTGYENSRPDLSDPKLIMDIAEKHSEKSKYAFLIISINNSGKLTVRKQDEQDIFSAQMSILSETAVNIATLEIFPDNTINAILDSSRLINELNAFCIANKIEYTDHYLIRNGNITSCIANDLI